MKKKYVKKLSNTITDVYSYSCEKCGFSTTVGYDIPHTPAANNIMEKWFKKIHKCNK